MKQILIVLLSLLCFTAFSETAKAPWQIVRYTLDTKKTDAEIDKMVSDGYMPTGLFIQEGKTIDILYIYSEKKLFTKWTLKQFKNLDSFDKDCTEFIKAGWVPVALYRGKGGVYLLFLDLGTKVNSWRIASGETDMDSVNKMLADYKKEGFVCYDLSTGYDFKNWYLFLRTPQSIENKTTVLSVMEDPGIIDNKIDGYLQSGWQLWGYAYFEKQFTFLFFQN